MLRSRVTRAPSGRVQRISSEEVTEFLFNTVQMFVDQQEFFYMLDKDGTAYSALLECIAICAVEILHFQNAQNFTKVSHLTSQTRACIAQAHHAHDIINPYFTNKNT